MPRPPRSKLHTSKYGLRIRRRYESVMAKVKATYKCPKCGAQKVRRVFIGVWRCGKCGFTFCGGAWEPRTTLSLAAERSLPR